jgi:hypothetical protein
MGLSLLLDRRTIMRRARMTPNRSPIVIPIVTYLKDKFRLDADRHLGVAQSVNIKKKA